MKKIQDYLAKHKETKLSIVHSHRIEFAGHTANFTVLGAMTNDLGALKVTLQIRPLVETLTHTTKLDLFDNGHVTRLARELIEKDVLENRIGFEADCIKLSELLQKHREAKLFPEEKKTTPLMDIHAEKAVHRYLSSKHLLKNLDRDLKTLGIIGESDNRLLTFLIAISYKTERPLHGVIQSTSGSGKSHLMNTVASCFPEEDVISLTRVTSKSLYYYSDEDLSRKLVLLQDFTGLDDESMYAFRELQSAGQISTSTTTKDSWGELVSSVKTVRSHFSSLSASTKDIYTDNLSRSIVVKIDESPEQTKKIIRHQNEVIAGKASDEKQEETRMLISNLVRVLETLPVINPYADKLKLPFEAKMLRRLNQHFQHFILVITWLHQKQRDRLESGGRWGLISQKSDVEMGIHLFFESIMLKVDDLDNSTRHFFETLKEEMKSPDTLFTQRDIRHKLHLSKSHIGKCLRKLIAFEYVEISEGTANKGYLYKIVHWDDIEKKRDKIKKNLLSQVQKLA